MRRVYGKRVLAGIAVVAWIAFGRPGLGAGEQYPQAVRVASGYDGKPFEYLIQACHERDRYVVLRLSYPSPVTTPVPQNNTVPAEYYLPRGLRAGQPRRPAVIFLHILDGNVEMVRMTCSLLASHGIPAIFFKLPYYGERGFPEGPEAMARDIHLFLGAVSQAFADVQRTVDVLASRPEVDPHRIGIAGISLGGIIAATAAERDARIHRALLVLAGGDLMTIIAHARETRPLYEVLQRLPPAERQAVERTLAEVDPLRHAGQLRSRAQAGRVRMINAAVDEVIPRPCTEKLAQALGIADRVMWLEDLGHYTALAALPQILRSMVEFFAADLPPGTQPPAPAAQRSPVKMVVGLAQQAVEFFTRDPGPGRCHFADLALLVHPPDGQPVEAQLRFIRGAGQRFRLECKAPVVGQVALGQGDFPWMASQKGVFLGSARPAPPADSPGADAGLVTVPRDSPDFRGQRRENGTVPLRADAQGGPEKAAAAGQPSDPLAFADPRYLMRLKMLAGAVGGAMLAPDILDPLATITEEPGPAGLPVIRIEPKGRHQGVIRLRFQEDRTTPETLDFEVRGFKGTVRFRVWQLGTVAQPELFVPPTGLPVRELQAAELCRIFSAMFNFAMELAE